MSREFGFGKQELEQKPEVKKVDNNPFSDFQLEENNQ